MDRKKQLKRPPAPELSRHLLPWFPVDSFEFSLFPPGYVLQCLQIDQQTAADLCGVSVATVARWTKTEPPRWFMPYILACCGFLLADGWQGWRVMGERLHQPNTRRHSLFYEGFTQGDFRALEFTRMNYAGTAAKMRDLASENARLRAFQRPRKPARPIPDNIIRFELIRKTRRTNKCAL